MRILICFIFFAPAIITCAQPLTSFTRQGRAVQLSSANSQLRITPYGNYIVRVQSIKKNEDYFPDEHYEMVESHQWPGIFTAKTENTAFQFTTGAKDGIAVRVDRNNHLISFKDNISRNPFFLAGGKISWDADTTRMNFTPDPAEHFTGLGHGYFGREESIDLAGKTIHRNYGTEHGQQAPLLVPFYMSDKGYGIFLNSTFPNEFNFGRNNAYSFSISGKGQMDFFVIYGPSFSAILDRYTQLTGRPRLPPKAFFGLALSDKGNDHNSTDPSDENWWKKKIMDHRNAGFPLDHIVNDNRWRAGGGQRCVSKFEWDPGRYPDPTEWAKWIRGHGLITTLDLNRCISEFSAGWKKSYNLPQTEGIEFNTSAPDLTKKEVRDWFWNLFWTQSLKPSLQYPGDALWIDEFDEMGKAPLDMRFEDGSTWKEMRNYWFFLIAKALVQQGWDKSFNGSKRPFVWVRGMTAGAQRYATLWSGDIKSTYSDMQTQVRGLQLAGLSGFPFWGHDAGGFYLNNSKESPNDSLYRQWSMAFGSFTPFWKPHGVGKSRWPLDRPEMVQQDAKLYSDLRYRLIPYIYSYAHVANQTGMPMARAMVLSNSKSPLAWTSSLQYMWGNELLVAPNCTDKDSVSIWLPEGGWFDFWNDELVKGNRTINYSAPLGKLPLFVRTGSIIPMANFALSTAYIPKDSLTIHVYPGSDASFTLFEDDGITEEYKTAKALRKTIIRFNPKAFSLEINPATGNYRGAPAERAIQVEFHGLQKPFNVEVNGKILKPLLNIEISEGLLWNEKRKLLTILIPKTSVAKKIVIKRILN